MWWPNRYCFFGRQIGLLKLVSGNKARYNQLSISQSRNSSEPLISQSKFSGTRKFTLRYQCLSGNKARYNQHSVPQSRNSSQTSDISK